MEKLTKKNKVLIAVIVLISIAIIGVSYAYYVARLQGNESSTTVDATSSILQVTYTDGSAIISENNLAPGWSSSKTFSVKNTGSDTAVYYLKLYDITNDLVNGGLKYSISSSNGGASLSKRNVPTVDSVVSNGITINKNITHNYSINVYYEDLDVDQSSDLGKTFTFKVGASESN